MTSKSWNFSRRALLATPLAALLPAAHARAAAGAPLEVYYSDDVTQVLTNLAPWRRNRETLSEALFTAALDEAVDAGADHYIVQPGLCWVPWWKSAIEPADAHYRWFYETFGGRPGPFGRYMIEGGDVLGAYLAQARRRRIPLTASIRLNDQHAVFFAGVTPQQWRSFHDNVQYDAGGLRGLEGIPRVQYEHPEWRLDPTPPDYTNRRAWKGRLWNWAVPAVVEYRASILEELIRNYPIDGLELDYMRFPLYFRDDEPAARRAAVMQGFLTRIRAALDQHGRPQSGARRCQMALRLPLRLSGWAGLGLSPDMLRRVGVDRVTLSAHTFTSQDLDFAATQAALSGMRVVLELGQAKHVRLNNLRPREQRGPDDDPLLLCQPEDFFSTARLASEHTMPAVSFFNFVYYRQNAGATTSFTMDREPPWAVMRQVKQPAAAPQRFGSWYLSVAYADGIPDQSLPQELRAETAATPLRLNVGVAPGPRGGRLRLAIADRRSGGPPSPDSQWQVSLNGQPLSRANTASSEGLPEEDGGVPFQLWQVPPGVAKAGQNALAVRQFSGPATRLWIAELFT